MVERMPSLEVRPFSAEHLGAAGELLAERHRRHRTAEPLLPSSFEDPAAAQGAVEAAWGKEGAAGAVALRGGRVIGYVIGAPEDDQWGPNIWVELAGHAVEEPDVVRDLYAAVAGRAVEERRTRHYVLVPASDGDLLDAWYRLGFGQQQAYGIREVPAESWPDGVRQAEPGDLDALLELAPLISRHHAASPVFSDHAALQAERETSDADRAELESDLASSEIGTLVAERDGRAVGLFSLIPVELAGDGVESPATLARPERACYLGFAATDPAARGSGTGVLLTNAAFAWAHRSGYSTMVTDWRVANLLASRFWPRRGFRTSFLRLYRSIP
jgi:GNAT superfamily N-acetyltransferase